MSSSWLAIAAGALRGHLAEQQLERQQQLVDDEKNQRKKDSQFRALDLASRVADQPGFSVEDADTPAPEKVPTDYSGSLFDVAAQAANTVNAGRTNLGTVDVGAAAPKRIVFNKALSTPALAEAERQINTAHKDQVNRSAFAELHSKNAKGYGSYIPGFDYDKELSKYNDDQRASDLEGKREASAEGREEGREQRRQKRELKTGQARTRAANMLDAGASIAQTLAAINTDPELRGYITYDDVKAVAREVKSTEDPDFKERRDNIVRNKQVSEPPATSFHQELLDLRASGHSGSEILAHLEQIKASPETIKEARKYLKVR